MGAILVDHTDRRLGRWNGSGRSCGNRRLPPLINTIEWEWETKRRLQAIDHTAQEPLAVSALVRHLLRMPLILCCCGWAIRGATEYGDTVFRTFHALESAELYKYLGIQVSEKKIII